MFLRKLKKINKKQRSYGKCKEILYFRYRRGYHIGLCFIQFVFKSNQTQDILAGNGKKAYNNLYIKYVRLIFLCSAINEQEKEVIRRGLLTNLAEPVNQIAVQLAVLVAKIARFDYPKEWPELFPTLIQGVESSDSVVQHRSLLTMHHVIKAVSSKRLAGT